MVEWIGNTLGLVSWYWALTALVAPLLFILAVVLYLVRRRLPPYARKAVVLIYALIIMRFVLFWNPLIWSFYFENFGNGNIPKPVFTKGRVFIEKRKFQRKINSERLPYLAVGSSQTGVLYYAESRLNDDVELFFLPGMMPIGYYFYRHHIRYLDPCNIVLYLSVFDIARSVNTFQALEHSPSQGFRAPEIFWWIIHSELNNVEKKKVWRLIFEEFLPELKWAFVLKSVTHNFLGNRYMRVEKKPEDLDMKDTPTKAPIRKEFLYDRAQFKHNVSSLEKFIEFSIDEGINVVILHGSVHPDFRLDENSALREEAEELFKKLAHRHDRVRYIPLKDLYQFSLPQYSDGIHVTGESARLFTEHLFKNILTKKGEAACK